MKITLIVPYFGTWPPWFPAFLLSCKYNPQIEWLFLTDCELPPITYDNVRFIQGSLNDLSKLSSEKLGQDISLASPYKICDLRPAFGIVFADYLSDSTFWGHCDVDIVWGDIRNFITDEILCTHDIISTRKHHIAGHFTLFRNTPRINNIFKSFQKYPEIFKTPKPTLFDERAMTLIVQELSNRKLVNVFWPRFLLNFHRPKTNTPSKLHGYTKGWYWKRGKIFDQTEGNNEIMYLHFMTWKDTLKNIDFDYTDEPDAFYITSTHISQIPC